MVEILILASIIIGIRAVYLWTTKGKEDAKTFVDKSSNEMIKTAGWIALIVTIGFILLILLLIALFS